MEEHLGPSNEQYMELVKNGDTFGKEIGLASIIYFCLRDGRTLHGSIMNKLQEFVGCESAPSLTIDIEHESTHQGEEPVCHCPSYQGVSSMLISSLLKSPSM
jgi:hypothetical protein